MSLCKLIGRAVASVTRAAQAAYLRCRGLYGAIDVDEIPDTLEPRRLYIVGEDGQRWYAVFLCPCGCDTIIHASLLQAIRPSWRLKRHFAGAVSLHPSMWRTKGCRSHFWLRRGKVIWC
jgi:hypothetical protein